MMNTTPAKLDTFETIVCGAGPAGLSAALASVQSGQRTLLLERLPAVGTKLLASGGGRCNFSNMLPDTQFMLSFGRCGRFMTDALRVGGRKWLSEFLKSCGIETISEDGFHCFPSTGRASSVRDAFLNAAKDLGLEVRTLARVDRLLIRDGILTGAAEVDRIHPCKKLILAAGGNAMSTLGGCPLGLKLAESAGHKITPPLPAMAPIYASESWVASLSGVSLTNAELSFSAGRIHEKTHGELLFTHDGFSGPAALSLSGPMGRAWKEHPDDFRLTLSVESGADFRVWSQRIDEARKQEPEKLFKSFLSKTMPNSLAAILAELAGLEGIKNHALKNVDRDRAAALLAGIPLTVSRLCPMEKAMAMSGGVSLSEVNPKTMESKLVKGLFFAGEVLDLTGPCGGYNIQFAIASGRLAGLNHEPSSE